MEKLKLASWNVGQKYIIKKFISWDKDIGIIMLQDVKLFFLT